MSKPKFTWQEKEEGEPHFPLYGEYAEVRMVIYQTPEMRYRFRCLAPKKTKFLGKSTWEKPAQARKRAEIEAKRIHQKLPPVDYDKVEDLEVKAREFDEIVTVIMEAGFKPRHGAETLRKLAEILRPTGLKLDEAAYRIALLLKMAGGREPEEIIGKYLDEFVRVRDHKTFKELVALMKPIIEGSPRSGKKEKRTNIGVLEAFAEPRADRLAETLTVPELKLWYNSLKGEMKWRYDQWLFIRQMVEIGYKEYGVITKWVYDRTMELSYWANAGTLHAIMPLKMRIAIVNGCQYANDVLYEEIMANVPIREAELSRLFWENIKLANGIPKRFFLPEQLTKGRKGRQEARYVDIPDSLGKLLLALWRDSGPILVGTTHQVRLAQIALDIDPNFIWEQNYFRRTCISFYVGAFGQKQYYAEQAGHDEKVQKKRYLRPVDKDEALLYVAYSPDPTWVKTLPYSAADTPPARGRPRKSETAAACNTPAEISTPCPDQVPAPAATTVNGKVAANQLAGKAEKEAMIASGPEVKNRATNRQPPSRAFIKWPPDNEFFRWLWKEPASKIRMSLMCSQSSVLTRARRLFGKLIPGHRYWQRKNAGLNPEIPAEVFVLQAKLDAAAASTSGPVSTPNAPGPSESLGEVQPHDKAEANVGALGPDGLLPVDSSVPRRKAPNDPTVAEVNSSGQTQLNLANPVLTGEPGDTATDHATSEANSENNLQEINT